MNPSPPSHNPADALLQQAKILLDANRAEQAVPLLLQAYSLDPSDALLPCHLSYTFSKLGDLKNALHYAEEALSRDPDNEWAHRLRGHVFWSRGKLKEALKCAREAQRVDPDEPQVYRMQADLFMAQRKYKEAHDAAQTMRYLAPEMSAPLLLLARINLGLVLKGGKHTKNAANLQKEAEAFARHALSLDPDLPDAHTVLGETLNAQRKTGEALDAFYQASRLDPASSDIQGHLSNSLFGRFFVLPTLCMTVLLFPIQALVYRWGGLVGAGITGSLVSGFCVRAVTQKWGTHIALYQKSFRALPDVQRETLLNLLRARRGPVAMSAGLTAGVLSAVPMILILLIMAKMPHEGRVLVRGINHVLGVAPAPPAKMGKPQEIGPWKIAVAGVEMLPIVPAPKSRFPTFGETPWQKAARLPNRRIIAVRVQIENRENKTYSPILYPSQLNDAQNRPVSIAYGNSDEASGQYGQQTHFSTSAQTEWDAWRPHETKSGHLFFVVGNDRPAFLVMYDPTDPDEKAVWHLTRQNP